MGNYNTGGAGTAPRFQAQPRRDPMTPEGGAIMDPNVRGATRPGTGGSFDQSPAFARPGYLGPAGGQTEILNRPSTNEIPTRPAVRPMGGFQPIDDRRDIMDPNLRGGGGGRMSGGINPGGMYNPNRGPRSYQPGHGDGSGGYGMRGDVTTKGVQNASMDDPMQGDPNDPMNLRVKRKYERGMSGATPEQSYSSVGGASI